MINQMSVIQFIWFWGIKTTMFKLSSAAEYEVKKVLQLTQKEVSLLLDKKKQMHVSNLQNLRASAKNAFFCYIKDYYGLFSIENKTA